MNNVPVSHESETNMLAQVFCLSLSLSHMHVGAHLQFVFHFAMFSVAALVIRDRFYFFKTACA